MTQTSTHYVGSKESKSFFDMEMEFADACDIFKGKVDGFAPNQRTAVTLAANLVHEEVVEELTPALKQYGHNPSLENKVLVADAIADSIYVLCQLSRACGIPLNEVYAVVHAANMKKVDPHTGKVIRREDGKILKPEGWVPPEQQIWEILFQESNRQAVQDGTHGAENWSNTAEVMQKHSGQQG